MPFSLWPAVGLTVLDEGGGTITTAGISISTLTEYYESLVLRGNLLTFDPLDLGGTPSSVNTPALSTENYQDASVTLAKLANLATDRIIGRSTAGTGVPEAITCTAAARSLLDDASTGAMLTTLGAAASAVTISAGTGLTGGGDLSANRTLTVAYGSTSTTACVGNDSRLSDSRTPADGSVTYAKTDSLVAVQATDSGKSDSTSAQNIFGTDRDTFTVTAQTYLMTGSLRFEWDGVPTSTDIDLLFGGTATVSYCIWDSLANSHSAAPPAVNTTAPQAGRSADATNTVFRAAGTDRYRWGFFRGAVSFSAGGTFIPQFQLSLTTGFGLSIKQGSFMEMRPVGTGIQGAS